ncbi:hypothetical protein ACMWHU_27635, partial [Klebsiella pneumoniae]
MIAIPNERLRERAREKVMGLELAVTQTAFADSHAELEEELELPRIALASLEAEPIYQLWDEGYYDTEKETYDAALKAGGHGRIVYTAPPAPVSVPDLSALDNLAGEMLNHAMNCERRVSVAYTHCAHRLAEEVRDLRAAMLQGADGNSPVVPDGWVMVPKEPTEVMFNAGKLAAGPTKQPDTASLVYKAMIDSSPDYKVGRETAFTGYEVQENVKDYVRRKIHTAFDVEKAVLWILKNSKYPEPDLWVFDIKVQFVDGPLILTDKSVTVVH